MSRAKKEIFSRAKRSSQLAHGTVTASGEQPRAESKQFGTVKGYFFEARLRRVKQVVEFAGNDHAGQGQHRRPAGPHPGIANRLRGRWLWYLSPARRQGFDRENFNQRGVELDAEGDIFEAHGRVQVDQAFQRGERFAAARIDDRHTARIPTA